MNHEGLWIPSNAGALVSSAVAGLRTG
jgi:hypothetical protein